VRTPALMRRPWAHFSAKAILVRGGPETQVWWVKVLLTWCAASERVRGSTILDI